MRNIDTDWAQWAAAGFGAKDLYITEWNVQQGHPFTYNDQFGLKGASVLVEMMERMIDMGVDGANVWPLQHNFTKLVDDLPDLGVQPDVTPRGEVFRLMAESLPGTRLLDSNLTTANGMSYELSSYASRGSYVFFVSSRSATSQTINLDLSEVVTSYSALAGVKVGFDPTTADGKFDPDDNPNTANDITVPDYQDPDALALLTVLQNLGAAGSLNLTLGAYEVARLVFTVATGLDLTAAATGQTLTGAAGHDSLLGAVGADVLNGAQGDDTLKAGAGNDTINGGTGNNYVDGGTNTDTLIYSTNAAILVNLGLTAAQDTGEGWHRILNVENLTTGSGRDALTGNSLANVIVSQAGNDTVSGSAGNDTLNGGLGNDVLNGDAGTDTLVFSSNADISVSLAVTTAQETGEGTDTLSTFENVTTGNGDDTVTGTTEANVIVTGAGNDRITYTSGADTVNGGAGVDTLVISGSLAGSVNLLSGANGHAMVISGIENLTGGTGADSLSGDNASNVLTGSAGDDDLYGNGGADSLYGGDGLDLLMAGDGNDVLSGAAGSDTILGQQGADTLTGGTGDDLFRYQSASQGDDTITDFNNVTGNNDRFSISVSGFGGLTVGSLADASFWSNTTGLAHDSSDASSLRRVPTGCGSTWMAQVAPLRC